MRPVLRNLAAAVDFARNAGELRRDSKARELWAAVYPVLSDGKPGLLGAVTSRAEAQVMRLAAIYALIDRSRLIQAAHLQAGLALWEYCEDSARYIFGAATGDAVADKILEALQTAPAGITKSEITRELLQRNVKAQKIDSALSFLERQKLAIRQPDDKTGGRQGERFVAAKRRSTTLTT